MVFEPFLAAARGLPPGRGHLAQRQVRMEVVLFGLP